MSADVRCPPTFVVVSRRFGGEIPLSDSASRPSDSAAEDGRDSVAAFPRAGTYTLLHNLPLELSSFIGREREIVQIKELLADCRLLTLTGAGGSGKTRSSSCPRSPECVEGEQFSELRLYGVLRRSHQASADGIMLGGGKV